MSEESLRYRPNSVTAMRECLREFARKLGSFRCSIENVGSRQRTARALAFTGEARKDGLVLEGATSFLEIRWRARDIHPWDRSDPPEERARLFMRQALKDTERAIAKLFRALPEIDVIRLDVLDREGQSVLIAGTVRRADVQLAVELSTGMRLRQLGLQFHSDGLRLEPLHSVK